MFPEAVILPDTGLIVTASHTFGARVAKAVMARPARKVNVDFAFTMLPFLLLSRQSLESDPKTRDAANCSKFSRVCQGATVIGHSTAWSGFGRVEV